MTWIFLRLVDLPSSMAGVLGSIGGVRLLTDGSGEDRWLVLPSPSRCLGTVRIQSVLFCTPGQPPTQNGNMMTYASRQSHKSGVEF